MAFVGLSVFGFTGCSGLWGHSWATVSVGLSRFGAGLGLGVLAQGAELVEDDPKNLPRLEAGVGRGVGFWVFGFGV